MLSKHPAESYTDRCSINAYIFFLSLYLGFLSGNQMQEHALLLAGFAKGWGHPGVLTTKWHPPP